MFQPNLSNKIFCPLFVRFLSHSWDMGTRGGDIELFPQASTYTLITSSNTQDGICVLVDNGPF